MGTIGIKKKIKSIGKMGKTEAIEYRKKVLQSSVKGQDRSDLLTACEERISSFGNHSPMVTSSDLNDFEVMSNEE